MVTVSRSKGSTVFCKLELHALKLSQISRNRAHSVIGRDIDQVTRATKTESVTSGTSTAVPQRTGGGAGGGGTREVNPMKWTLLYHRIHSHLVLLLNLT